MISKKMIAIGLLSVNTGLFAQAGNVGINTTTPTQALDVNGNVRFRNVPDSNIGTTDRIMILADDGTAKKIGADQILNQGNISTLTYVRKTDSPIDSSTPDDTAIHIGDLWVRYAGTGPNSPSYIEYAVDTSQHVTMWYKKAGAGGVGLDQWGTRATPALKWNKLCSDTGDNKNNISPQNRDVSETIIILHNSKNVYRVTTNFNGDISASGTVPAVNSSATIFVEKLAS